MWHHKFPGSLSPCGAFPQWAQERTCKSTVNGLLLHRTVAIALLDLFCKQRRSKSSQDCAVYKNTKQFQNSQDSNAWVRTSSTGTRITHQPGFAYIGHDMVGSVPNGTKAVLLQDQTTNLGSLYHIGVVIGYGIFMATNVYLWFM